MKFRIKNVKDFRRDAAFALLREYKEARGLLPTIQEHMPSDCTSVGIQVDRIIEIYAERHGSGDIEEMRNRTFNAHRKEILLNTYELARSLNRPDAVEYFGGYLDD